MKLSVVVPYYNVAKYFRQCLESIAGQTLNDLQVILVDDGSTDESIDIAAEFVRADSRFVLVRQSNTGLGPARNAGVQHAVGEYLTFVDSDDIIPRRAFEIATRRLDRSGSDFLAGNAQRFNMHGTRASWLHARLFHTTRRGTSLHERPELAWDRMIWNKIYRTAFWRSGDYQFPAIRYEDYPVTLSTYRDARKIDISSEVGYLWRERDDASDGSITQRFFELDNLEDRIESARRTLKVADALESAARQAVHEHLAATDVPALARAVAHPENDVHGTKVLALARDLTSRLDPGALAARPAWDRLLQHLIARGDRDSLVELVVARENGAAPRAHMAGRWKKRWELRLPGHHLGEVAPPVVLAVRPDEIFLRASVMDVRSTKTQIVLTVTAGLGCDLGDNAIVECWLALRGSAAIKIEGEVIDTELIENVDVRFQVSFDVTAVIAASPGEDFWDLHARVRSGRISRTGLVRQVRDPSVNLHRPHQPRRRAWVQAGRHRGVFALRVLRPRAVLDTVEQVFRGEVGVSGTTYLDLSGRPELELSNPRTDRKLRFPVLVDTAPRAERAGPARWWARVPLALVADDALFDHPFDEEVHWTMALASEAGATTPRVIPGLRSPRVTYANHEVEALPNRWHAAQLAVGSHRFVAVEACFEGALLHVGGGWATPTSATAPGLGLVKAGAGEDPIAVATGHRSANGDWAFAIDLNATLAPDPGPAAEDDLFNLVVDDGRDRYSVHWHRAVFAGSTPSARVGDRQATLETHHRLAARLRISKLREVTNTGSPD